jgi:hypothetical protein
VVKSRSVHLINFGGGGQVIALKSATALILDRPQPICARTRPELLQEKRRTTRPTPSTTSGQRKRKASWAGSGRRQPSRPCCRRRSAALQGLAIRRPRKDRFFLENLTLRFARLAFNAYLNRRFDPARGAGGCFSQRQAAYPSPGWEGLFNTWHRSPPTGVFGGARVVFTAGMYARLYVIGHFKQRHS